MNGLVKVNIDNDLKESIGLLTDEIYAFKRKTPAETEVIKTKCLFGVIEYKSKAVKATAVDCPIVKPFICSIEGPLGGFGWWDTNHYLKLEEINKMLMSGGEVYLTPDQSDCLAFVTRSILPLLNEGN